MDGQQQQIGLLRESIPKEDFDISKAKLLQQVEKNGPSHNYGLYYVCYCRAIGYYEHLTWVWEKKHLFEVLFL